MKIELEGFLNKDLRAETMKAQILQGFGDLKPKIKEVKVYAIPGSASDMSELKSYGFNTYFYGGSWHKSQATTMLGLKGAVTKMRNSGKELEANYRRLINIWNAVIGFRDGRHYNSLLYKEFGDWHENPKALSRCWEYAYEALDRRNVIRTDDHRKEAFGASLFWTPDDPKESMRDPETKGTIYVEFDERMCKVNGGDGGIDRPYIREISFVLPQTSEPQHTHIKPDESARLRLLEIRDLVDFNKGPRRSYDRPQS